MTTRTGIVLLCMGCSFALASEPARDQYGDLLPKGAVARLGTLKFRHGGLVRYVEFMPDAKSILSHGDDHTFRVFDIKTGRELRHFGEPRFHTAGGMPAGTLISTTTLAMSNDGTLVAQGFVDGTVWVYSTETGKREVELKAQHYVGGLAFLDNKHIVTRSDGSIVEIWNLETKQREQQYSKRPKSGAVFRQGGSTHRIRPCDQAKNLVMLSEERADKDKERPLALAIVERDSGKDVHELYRFAWAGLVPWDVTPDGKFAAISTDARKKIRVFDTATGKEAHVVEFEKEVYANSIVLAPDGKSIVTVEVDQSAKLWDIATGKLRHVLAGPLHQWNEGNVNYVAQSWIQPASFSPDGKTIALAGRRAAVTLIDVESGMVKAVPAAGEAHDAGIVTAAISPDSKAAWTRAKDASVRRWDLETGKLVGHLPFGPRAMRASLAGGGSLVAVLGDQELQAKGDNDPIVLWDFSGDKAKRIREIEPPKDGMTHMTASPDGKLLAMKTTAGKIFIYDVAADKETREFVDEAVPPGVPLGINWGANAISTHRLGFTPDGVLLYSVSGGYHDRTTNTTVDTTIRAWNVRTGKESFEMRIPKRRVASVAISPDHRTIAICDHERNVVFWEACSGKERAVIENVDAAALPTLVFTPDGRRLVAGTPSGILRVFDMELAKELTALAGHRGPIHDLLVSRDGKRLLSASEDSTVLVWDVGSLPPLPPSEEIHLEAHDLEALGKDLESADAARAFKAIVRLAKAPSQSIPWLDARLKATTFDPARVADLFKQLDSDDFATRKNAEEQLASLGDKIEQLLRKAAENNPSVDVRRAAERLLDGLKNRNVPSARLAEFRAVELLERIGSSEARMLLERLSKGDDETRLTVEAKGALHRLGKDVPRP